MYLFVPTMYFKCLFVCLCTKNVPISVIHFAQQHLFVCMPYCFTFTSAFLCVSVVCYLTLFLLISRFLCICVCVCVCDEPAGNWLLNGATVAVWDKIETRETESPIHLLSVKSTPLKQLALSLSLYSPPAEQ